MSFEQKWHKRIETSFEPFKGVSEPILLSYSGSLLLCTELDIVVTFKWFEISSFGTLSMKLFHQAKFCSFLQYPESKLTVIHFPEFLLTRSVFASDGLFELSVAHKQSVAAHLQRNKTNNLLPTKDTTKRRINVTQVPFCWKGHIQIELNLISNALREISFPQYQH